MISKDYFVANPSDRQTFDEAFSNYKVWHKSNLKNSFGSHLEEHSILDDKQFLPVSELLDKYSFLNSIQKSEEVTSLFEYMVAEINDYFNPLGQSQAEYDFMKSLVTVDNYDEVIKQRSLDNFENQGLNLPESDKARLNEIQKELSQLGITYSNNLVQSKKEWKHAISEAEYLVLSKEDQQYFKKEEDQWVLSYNMNDFSDILVRSENSHLRQIAYEASGFLGSPASSFDNSELVYRIIELRKELASLLGKADYTEVALRRRMAKDFDTVDTFLTSLRDRLKPLAKRELSDLHQFVKEHYGLESLNRWDYGFYSNKKKEKELNLIFDQERPYFPEQKALSGAFSLINKLFDITFERDDSLLVKPHDDIQVYKVFDKGALKSLLVVDLYERENKQGGAWVSGMIPPTRDSVGLVALVCNFDRKKVGLSLGEVNTLLHEFGHAVHHFSSTTKYQNLAGTSGMARDAVEIPSQMLEQFTYNEDFLREISSHYQTGESIPEAMIKTLIASKNYGIGGFYSRQIAFALFDIRLHHGFEGDIHQLYRDIANDTLPLSVDPSTTFPNNFSHIFAGGYSAGYYGYLWSDVYSVDSYLYIIEDLANNARSFKEKFLSHGSSQSPEVLYESFRGQPVDMERFISYYGI